MEKISFLHGKLNKKLNKKDLFNFLAIKSLKYDFKWMWRKGLYHGFDNILLRNLERINCIQIYNDGCIRLHLKNNHYEDSKSIIIDDYEFCNDISTLIVIDDLDTYCKYN